MNARAPTALQQERTRVLLIDTDNLFLDDVGTTLEANEDVEVLATARSIEDAYTCAAKHVPDLVVISWNRGSRAFVQAAADDLFPPATNPLVVVVLPGDITSTPGLSTLCLMPNVALVVHTQLGNLLRRHTSPAFGMRVH